MVIAETTTPVSIECEYLTEPLLEFGDGGHHVDPKAGIARYGPYSVWGSRHPEAVRIGVIGTSETIEKSVEWIKTSAPGVRGDKNHPEFPGFQRDRGFLSEPAFQDSWVGQITQTELNGLLGIRNSRSRFEKVLEVLETKLRLLAELDQSPDYVVLAIPDAIYKECRTVEYTDKELGRVHRDLRRAFKALAMNYRIPTQFLRQPTMEGKDHDHPAKIAWNFFTGMYSKAGGVPWAPTALTPATCYLGISFYRPISSEDQNVRASLVQAFDEHGEGLVLRGHEFRWDPRSEGSRTPHLSSDQANALVNMALDRYEAELGQQPRRVVVHKTSRYWPAEREGFSLALARRADRFDLLAIEHQSQVRLFTESSYPPLRGTRFIVGDTDFLYTTGFLPDLGEYHGLHVPSPIQIADHVGQDTPRAILMQELLALTKMNWNSSQLGGSMPITIRFSRLVGDILREIPDDRDPLPQQKFYI